MASPAWKNFRLLRVFCRPLLLVSLGLHGILLLLPLTLETEVIEVEQQEETQKETIKITRLAPPQPSPTPEISPSTPKVSPQQRSQPPQPQPTAIVAQPQPKPQRLVQPSPQTTPIVSPSPTIAPTPTVSPSPTVAPTPTVSPSGNVPSSPEASPVIVPSEGKPSKPPILSPQEDSFVDKFPIYENSRQGSGINFLPQAIDDSVLHTLDPLGDVAAFFEREIPSKGFNPLEVKEENENSKIYQVSLNSLEPRYLHLFALENRTLIAILDNQVSLEKLKNFQDDIAELSPEDKIIEQIFEQIYQEFSLKNFTVADLQNSNSPFADETKYHFRGRIPIEDSPGFNEQQLKERLFSLLAQEGFAEGGAMTQNGVEMFLFQKENTAPTISFVPVGANGQTTIGILTMRQLSLPF